MMEMFSKQGVSVPVTTMMVMEAYQHVKQGGEAAGIDGMTWEYLHTHRSRLLYQLWVRLASGSYFPKAIKAVSIPKKDGSKRVLGLPTLLDRIARASSKGSLRKDFRTAFSSKLIRVQSGEEYARCIAPGKVQLLSIPVCDYAGHQKLF